MIGGYFSKEHSPEFGEPTCPFCDRSASEIPEVVDMAEEERLTPSKYAMLDGTYNNVTNHFCCDTCYIAMGAPSLIDGWKAP